MGKEIPRTGRGGEMLQRMAADEPGRPVDRRVEQLEAFRRGVEADAQPEPSGAEARRREKDEDDREQEHGPGLQQEVKAQIVAPAPPEQASDARRDEREPERAPESAVDAFQ